MTAPKITVWQRHLVETKSESLQNLKEITKEARLAAGGCNDFDFKILLSVRSPGHNNYSPILWDEIRRTREELEGDVVVYTTADHGVGSSLFKAMFAENNSRGGVVFVLDGDQFDVSCVSVLNAIDLLAGEMRDRRALVGLGRRDFVRLADTEVADKSRKIVEAYHAKFVSISAAIENRGTGPSTELERKLETSYTRYGDPIPGFYALNLNLKSRSSELRNMVYDQRRRAFLDKYAGDPYFVMEAFKVSGRRKIPSIYVPTKEHPAGEYDLKTIEEVHRELGMTDIGRGYKVLIEDNQIARELGKIFVSHELVQDVRGKIRRGIDSGLRLTYR